MRLLPILSSLLGVGAFLLPSAAHGAVLYEYNDWVPNRLMFVTSQILTQPTTITNFHYTSGPYQPYSSFGFNPQTGDISLTYLGGSQGNACGIPMLAAGSYNCLGLITVDITPFSVFRYDYSDFWGRVLSFTAPALLVTTTEITTFDSISGPNSDLRFTIDPVTGVINLSYLGGGDTLPAGQDFLGTGTYGVGGVATLTITAMDVPEPATFGPFAGAIVLGALAWRRRAGGPDMRQP
ncbi:MAG: hypothetical protein JNL98_15485 [Bryobacterales bacterium]|nr:hypothetical protein [Bryobacterales bacterium]